MTEVLAEQTIVSSKDEKKKRETPPPEVRGMVCYSDSGCRPNPGFAGIGIHSFVYNTALPLKGVGLNSVVTSTHGYVSRDETHSLWASTRTAEEVAAAIRSGVKYQVMPEYYLDYFATLAYPATNNLGELKAVNKAIELALLREVKHVQIYSDSEHTCKGMSRLQKLEDVNWTRADGQPIANVEEWKEAKRLHDLASNADMTIKINWVRGHNGDIGNELSDLLATMGVFQSRQKKEMALETVSPTDGYWKGVVDRHPFLSNSKLYFNTLAHAAQPGIYYIGHHGKDDDLIGTRNSETHLAVVKLSKPIEVIEMMRELQGAYNGQSDLLYQMYLDRLFNPDHFKFLNVYNSKVVEPPSGYRRDLNFLNGPPLTREFKPPLLAGRIVDGVTELDSVLGLYLNQDKTIEVIDLTDLLYDKTFKPLKKKEEEAGVSPAVIYTLKKDIGVSANTVDVKFPHPLDASQSYELKLTLGLDLLERNALKRLETFSPEVSLIIWRESALIFRFATVIKADKDIGIWAAPFSNLRVIVPPRTPEEIEASVVKKKTKKELKKEALV